MGESADELRRDIEFTRDNMSDTIDAIGDRVMPGRVMERQKNRAVQSVQSIRDRVMGTATGVKDRVGDGTGGAVETVKGVPDAVRHQAQGSPMVAGALAFGVGFLVAAIFPPTATEEQVVQDVMDKAGPLKAELAAAGQDVAGQVKETARDALEQVKTTAADGKDAVAETARGSVDATTSASQDAAESVKQQASS